MRLHLRSSLGLLSLGAVLLACTGASGEGPAADEADFGVKRTTTIEAPRVLATVTSTLALLEQDKTSPRLVGGTCPVTLATFDAPYTYVTVVNPNAKDAVVTIASARATGEGAMTAALTNVVATYASEPRTDEERVACQTESAFGKLTVVIPKDGQVVVYVASAAPFLTSIPFGATGTFHLDVRLDALVD